MPSVGKRSGVSRSVRGSSNSGAPYSIPHTRRMGPVAIQNAEQAGHERFQNEVLGLGTQSMDAIRDLQGGSRVTTPVEDFFGQQNEGGNASDDDEDAWEPTESELFTSTARDLLDPRIRGRTYRDKRTWRQRIQRLNANWLPRLDEMYDAYLEWKYPTESAKVPAPSTRPDVAMQSPPSSPRSEGNDVPRVPDHPPDFQFPGEDYSFKIEVLDIFTVDPEVTIHRDQHSKSVAEALILQGYIGNSPEHPSLALSIKTLELFRRIRLRKASFSVEAFAKVLCDIYNVPYRRRYRIALSNAFDAYLALTLRLEKSVADSLGRSGKNWRVLNACPACSYELEGEPHLVFSRLLAMDANFSLKRMASGKRQEGDIRTFMDSDYYLQHDEVNKYENEVKSYRRRPPAVNSDAPSTNSVQPEHSDDDDDTPAVDDTHGDPTDGSHNRRDGVVSGCAVRWKAAAADERKKMWGVFEETGIFASACRHGMILWIADLIRSGELAKYPLSIVAKALEILPPGFGLGYDIGCSFAQTIASSSLGPLFQASHSRCCVNAFHGYSHSYDCQKLHHPNVIEGMGLEDLEVLERIFSASNALGGITRYMTRYRRRLFIELFFRQWDAEKYANLGNMLHNNYVQALQIIDVDEPALIEAKQRFQISDQDLDQWHDDEVNYFRTLGREPEEDMHRVAYVELLQKYRDITAKFQSASSQFLLSTPSDASGETYEQALSATRKKETERRFLSERREEILHEITALEVKLQIDRRWDANTPAYREALQYAATRDYHRALDKLQRLVVQRLFELHRLNLNFTGYKMRTHIAKALQSRCKAIRNAVSAYNTAALKMIPPKPTVDWTKVSHYSFLEEFELLRRTRHDVTPEPWTKPTHRETIKQHLRIKRAREEIIRCNVEIRRVHTAILDEHILFDCRLRELKEQGSPLYGLVLEHTELRRRINHQILARFEQTYDLKGFTGTRTRGTRRSTTWSGLPADTTSSHPESQVNDVRPAASLSAAQELALEDEIDSDNDLEDGDDENISGDIGGIIDFISDLPGHDL